jgi:hypothetical protein
MRKFTSNKIVSLLTEKKVLCRLTKNDHNKPKHPKKQLHIPSHEENIRIIDQDNLNTHETQNLCQNATNCTIKHI